MTINWNNFISFFFLDLAYKINGRSATPVFTNIWTHYLVEKLRSTNSAGLKVKTKVFFFFCSHRLWADNNKLFQLVLGIMKIYLSNNFCQQIIGRTVQQVFLSNKPSIVESVSFLWCCSFHSAPIYFTVYSNWLNLHSHQFSVLKKTKCEPNTNTEYILFWINRIFFVYEACVYNETKITSTTFRSKSTFTIGGF